MDNYVLYNGLFNYTVLYPDIRVDKEYFISDKFNFPIKYIQDFGHPQKDYIIVHAKFKKKYLNRFIDILDKADNRSMIVGLYDKYNNAVTDFNKYTKED